MSSEFQKVIEPLEPPCVLAACVTLMTREKEPPLTVMAPERDDVNGLAVADTLIVPLPLPESGDTVSQTGWLLTVVQLMLEVMETGTRLLPDDMLIEVGDTLKEPAAAACVTGIVCVIPPPLTMMFASRGVVTVLTSTIAVKAPLFVPEVG